MDSRIIFYICWFMVASVSKAKRAADLTHYFIGTPDDATVFIGNDSDTFGDFHCATRHGYYPLWVVNGLNVAELQERAGYNGTYVEYIALQGEDKTLSYLSIPASAATNNSIVVCAAHANDSIAAYTEPVRLTVLQIIPTETATSSSIQPFTSSPSISFQASTAYPYGPKRAPNKTNHVVELSVLGAGLFILVCAAVAVVLVTGVFLTLCRKRDFSTIIAASKATGKSKEAMPDPQVKIVNKAERNIYWNVKTQTVLPPDPLYLEKQNNKDKQFSKDSVTVIPMSP